MKLSNDQIKFEIMACLEEQVYEGKLNHACLVLIGLWEIESKFIKKLVKEIEGETNGM